MAKAKQRFGTVDARKLIVDRTLNCRLSAGQMYGCNVPDTYDIPDMVTQIKNEGKILEHLWVSERADGTLVVLRGNRRTLGAQAVLNDAEAPTALKEEMTRLPAIIFNGLSQADEIEKVNDQGQKKFLRSEMIRQIWHLSDVGYSFVRIANMFWQQLGDWTGNAKKVAEIKAITDEKQRYVAIKKWLTTTLDAHILTVPSLGERVRKAFFLSCLKLDGLLKETDEQPEWDALPSNRTADLLAAKKEDGEAWSFDAGGPKFNEKIAEFINRDKNGIKRSASSSNRMSMDDLTRKAASSRSALAKACFTLAKGEISEQQPILDEAVYLFERKTDAVLACLDELPRDVASVLRLAFVTGTYHEFQQGLDALKAGLPIEEPEAANA